MKVGYIGLGAMGGELALQLVGKTDLSVFDLNGQAVNRMVAAGAKSFPTAAALAENSDVIILCLPRSQDVEQVLFGLDGVAQSLSAGKVVIDQTSGIPAMTARMAARLSEIGVYMIDAAIAGGVGAAQVGRATFMGSGVYEAWSRALPILQKMTPNVYRCSDRVGDGQAMKLVNNAIGAGYRIASLELAALGRKFGLPLKTISARLNAGSAINFTTRGMIAALLEGRRTINFSMPLMVKDLNASLAMAASCGASLPLTAAARAVMQITISLMGKETSVEDIIPTVERLSDVEFMSVSTIPVVAPPEGETPESLLATIEQAVEICNWLVVWECAAMGAAFGLSYHAMSTILNAGSAWSAAAEHLLGDIARGEKSILPLSLREATNNLHHISYFAMLVGIPAILPHAALATIESARRQFGDAANSGHVASLFGL